MPPRHFHCLRYDPLALLCLVPLQLIAELQPLQQHLLQMLMQRQVSQQNLLYFVHFVLPLKVH